MRAEIVVVVAMMVTGLAEVSGLIVLLFYIAKTVTEVSPLLSAHGL